MKYRFFIAGTDTDVGKTFVSVALLQAANSKGLSTAALKPVAAGCEPVDGVLRNKDALALQQVMSADLPYEQVNPVALAEPIAPHIAANLCHTELSVAGSVAACLPVLEGGSDFVLVEGAGGWRVPLNERESLSDLAQTLSLPVVLVVGMRLGCINHALLTVEAIHSDGVPIGGWVANQVDDNMSVLKENIATLNQRIRAPYLGHIPFLHNQSAVDASEYLDIDKLLGS